MTNQPTVPANPDLLTIREAAERLRISIRHMQILIKDGEIESFRHGNVVRIRPSAITVYINRHLRPPTPYAGPDLERSD